MATSSVTLAFFLLFAAGLAAGCRVLRRPLRLPEAAAFFLLTVVFLFPGFFRGRTILPVDHAMLLSPWAHTATATRYNANLNDAATQMAPWAKAVRMAWKEGSVPFRDRWNGSGMALAANGQSAPFSPFTFLMFPLPLWAGFNLLAAAKIFVALAGASLWLRELRVSRGAAAFGAILFALSFSIVPCLLFPLSAVFSLFPWVLFAIELSRDEANRMRATVLLTLLLFLWPLCGHPESVLVCALFAALWLGARIATRDLPDAKPVVGRLALAAAIALGLSAFLTVPEAIAIAASNRVPFAEAFRQGLLFSAMPHRPYWPAGFVTSLFPRAFGDAIASPMVPGILGAFPELTLGFFGLVGASAALLVFRPGSARARAELALAVPLVIGLAASTGTWPFYDLAIRAPGLRLMFVLRYLSWVAFAGSALAAFEIDRLARDVARSRRAALGVLVPAGALGILAVVVHRLLAPLHAQAGGTDAQWHALIAALVPLAAVASIALIAFYAFFAFSTPTGASSPRLARALPVLFAAAACAELGIQGGRLHRFGPPGWLFPDTPLLAFLRSRPVPFRVGGDAACLFPNTNVFAGVEDIRTHDPVGRRDYVAFLDRAAGYLPNDYFKKIRDWNAPELDLLNLRYLVGEPGQTFPGTKWRRVYDGPDGVVCENGQALSRVYARARIPPASRSLPDGFEISEYRETTNAISFRARVPPESGAVPAVVSVAQDGGWSATDEDSRTIPVASAAGVLVEVALPPGNHTIRLRYRPPGFALGAAASLATAGILAAVGLVRIRGKSRSRKRRASASGAELSGG